MARPGTGDVDTPAAGSPRVRVLAAVLVVATVAAYSGSFGGAFVFDDVASIVENPAIRTAWPPSVAMRLGLRPFVVWSFALNYAIGGLEVASYHAVNLVVHVAAALALFGVVRRTLRLPRVGFDDGQSAAAAFAVALLWAVHPLNTQAVVYVIQRAECMAALAVLVAHLCLVRAATAGPGRSGRRWGIACVLSFYAGLGCKETVVTAPLALLLYDAVLVCGSFTEPIRRRPALHAALWAPFVIVPLVWSLADPDRFGWLRATPDSAPALDYAYAQGAVLVRYVGLLLVPVGLNLDHAWDATQHRDGLPWAAGCVVAALAATAWAVVRRAPLGWLAAAFFMALAPSSSFHPLSDLLVEHRMYLASAACMVAIVLAARRGLAHVAPDPAVRRVVGTSAVALAATALAVATAVRIRDYANPVVVWTDVVEKAPHNARAHFNLGLALLETVADVGSDARAVEDRALAHFLRAAELRPSYHKAHTNAGAILFERGRTEEALERFRAALASGPAPLDAATNYATALTALGRHDEAAPVLRRAIDATPDTPEGRVRKARLLNDLGVGFVRTGAPGEAIAALEDAIAADPEFAGAYTNLASVLATSGRSAEALERLRRVCELVPRGATERLQLARALADGRHVAEAIDAYLATIALDPATVDARTELAVLCLADGDRAVARDHLEAVVRREPSNTEARRVLDALRRAR